MEQDEQDPIQSDMATYAAAFAQIKITGRRDARLKQRVLNAIRCFGCIMGLESELGTIMIRDLETFEAL